MTQHARRLPVHGDHNVATITAERDDALTQLTDVWAALNRARITGPTGAAELINQLAAQRDHARSVLGEAQELIDQLAAQRHRARATLDDVVEQLDEVQARYATRPGSPARGTQDAAKPAESHAQARIGPERDRGTTYPPAEMQAFLDYSTAEWRAARTADERWAAIRDLLEGWYDRWDAHYPGAVVDEHDGLARHLVALIAAAESRAADREG
ncbi:hypothetical protein [Salinispora sp. H7-4]|uniref:hypothetical protein n=1 Tax=Salinispora sp. H7-4 TaxID=2748321 RepID=UPI0015D1C698|nr:hypothetical protein [Salinispora sp. H7-4]NYT96311.1 hypothetical protein [Salinispora sp. H7-4]